MVEQKILNLALEQLQNILKAISKRYQKPTQASNALLVMFVHTDAVYIYVRLIVPFSLNSEIRAASRSQEDRAARTHAMRPVKSDVYTAASCDQLSIRG